jgi:hypothetical protein
VEVPNGARENALVYFCTRNTRFEGKLFMCLDWRSNMARYGADLVYIVLFHHSASEPGQHVRKNLNPGWMMEEEERMKIPEFE